MSGSGFLFESGGLNPDKCEEADGHGVCIEEEDLIGVPRFRLLAATAHATTTVTAGQRRFYCYDVAAPTMRATVALHLDQWQQ